MVLNRNFILKNHKYVFAMIFLKNEMVIQVVYKFDLEGNYVNHQFKQINKRTK